MSLTVIRAGAPIAETPVGAIQGYAGSSAPAGWLLCDGTAVSRTSYAELFGVIGTTYGSGDGSTTFNLPNTTGYIIYATRLATRVTVNQPPEYVTALPSSPTDGQEIYYAADATNGVIWHLRYRGSSSSSYKWEFVGGPPRYSQTSTDVTVSVTDSTWSGLNASDPSVTAPLAGDYIVTSRCSYSTAASCAFIMGVKLGTTEASGGDIASAYQTSTNGYFHSVASRAMRTSSAASNAFSQRYWHNNGTAVNVTRYRAELDIIPVRVG